MIKAFDPESEKFNLELDQPSITIKGVDVEEIFGLKVKSADGLDIDTIHFEDGKFAENEIPPHFLNKCTGSLSIDGLISDAIKSGLDDDDFLRRAALVALGTVLAPTSTATVPLEYWEIVKNWEVDKVQWPCGNLALLQYIYYEKVRPIGSQLTSSRPLMRNWTEEEAKKRDIVDYNDGRGVGLIDDDISAKHRREVIHTPDVVPKSKRKQSKRAKAAASSMNTPGPVDDSRMEVMFEQVLIKLTNHIDTTLRKNMQKYADASAQKLLKMLNSKGVAYRAGKADMSDDDDQEEEAKKEGVASTPSHGGLPPKDFMDIDVPKSDGSASWLNSIKDKHDDELDDASKKSEPVEDSNFVTPTDKKKTASAGYTTPAPKHRDTPEVPIIIDDKATPESSYSATIDLTLPDASEEFEILNTICHKAIASGKKEERKDDVCGKKEERKDDICGKRTRKPPRKLSSPSIVMTSKCPKRIRRAVRKGPEALFNNEYATDGSNQLTPEIIDAAVEYIRISMKSTKKGRFGKCVYENADGAGASAGMLKPILDSGWLCGAAYFSVNISRCHWVTVVMHSDKEEFQVLDSLWSLNQSKGFVEMLREEISKDIKFANNELSRKKYPDVSKWEIKSYPIPKQRDTNSCGLFLLACMEHWDGDKLTAEFSQETINKNRKRTAAEIIMAQSNLLEKTKKDVLDIAAKARAQKTLSIRYACTSDIVMQGWICVRKKV
nr:uncharacterized protein LOC127339646 [Lolium perenne]